MEEDYRKIVRNIIIEYSTVKEDYKCLTVPVRLDEDDIEALEKLLEKNELAKQTLIKNCNIADERNELLKENNELKGALLTNKNLYEEVCNKNKELEKENKKLTYARNWYFEHFTAREYTPEMLDKILRFDYIPKSLVKEKIEELDKRIKSNTTEEEYKKDKIYTCKDFNEFITSVLQELLGEKK